MNKGNNDKQYGLCLCKSSFYQISSKIKHVFYMIVWITILIHNARGAFRRKLPEEHEWQITEKVKETHDTYTYTLRPFSASQRFNFSIGQFVTLSAILKRPTASGGVEETTVNRAYSIASSPTRDFIELTIKRETIWIYQPSYIGNRMPLQLILINRLRSEIESS